MAAPKNTNANSQQCKNGKPYLLHFANHHTDFRISELVALADMFGINLPMADLRFLDKECPFFVVHLSSEADAKKLASRSVLIKSIIELWGHGVTHEDLFEDLRKSKDSIMPHLLDSSSFKIVVDGFNKSLPQKYKVQRIEKLTEDALPFSGKIDLKNPDQLYYLLEDYGKQSKNADSIPQHVYFGRWVADGNRNEIQNQEVNKRSFIGNTSMESSLSLLMANLSKVQKNMLVIDPFVGTGSILVPCAYHQAYVMGTDINYLLLHAKDILSEDDKTADSVAAPVNDAPIRMDHLDEMSVGGDHENVVEDFVNDDGVDILGTRKRAKTNTRIKWSKDEEDELRKYFSIYFDKTTRRTCPTRKECLEAISKSQRCGGSLHKRGWETIKKKMNNWIKKM